MAFLTRHALKIQKITSMGSSLLWTISLLYCYGTMKDSVPKTFNHLADSIDINIVLLIVFANMLSILGCISVGKFSRTIGFSDRNARQLYIVKGVQLLAGAFACLTFVSVSSPSAMMTSLFAASAAIWTLSFAYCLEYYHNVKYSSYRYLDFCESCGYPCSMAARCAECGRIRPLPDNALRHLARRCRRE
jgi:hypothetical protein